MVILITWISNCCYWLTQQNYLQSIYYSLLVELYACFCIRGKRWSKWLVQHAHSYHPRTTYSPPRFDIAHPDSMYQVTKHPFPHKLYSLLNMHYSTWVWPVFFSRENQKWPWKPFLYFFSRVEIWVSRSLFWKFSRVVQNFTSAIWLIFTGWNFYFLGGMLRIYLFFKRI